MLVGLLRACSLGKSPNLQIVFVLFSILQASATDYDLSEEFSLAIYVIVYLAFFELNFIGTLELYL